MTSENGLSAITTWCKHCFSAAVQDKENTQWVQPGVYGMMPIINTAVTWSWEEEEKVVLTQCVSLAVVGTVLQVIPLGGRAWPGCSGNGSSSVPHGACSCEPHLRSSFGGLALKQIKLVLVPDLETFLAQSALGIGQQINKHTHTHTCTHSHACTYTHTHTHTHTHTKSRLQAHWNKTSVRYNVFTGSLQAYINSMCLSAQLLFFIPCYCVYIWIPNNSNTAFFSYLRFSSCGISEKSSPSSCFKALWGEKSIFFLLLQFNPLTLWLANREYSHNAGLQNKKYPPPPPPPMLTQGMPSCT